MARELRTNDKRHLKTEFVNAKRVFSKFGVEVKTPDGKSYFVDGEDLVLDDENNEILLICKDYS